MTDRKCWKMQDLEMMDLDSGGHITNNEIIRKKVTSIDYKPVGDIVRSLA